MDRRFEFNLPLNGGVGVRIVRIVNTGRRINGGEARISSYQHNLRFRCFF